MSTLPPQPPTSAPPPPPPPPAEAAPGLPWENRTQLGFGPALIETIKLIVTAPSEAFSRMRERSDLFEALLFGVIVGWIGAALGLVWRLILPNPFLFLPGPMRERLGAMGFMAGAGIGTLIVMPFLVAIGLFVLAAIFHLFLMIFSGLASSKAGFEGTFRVVCYSGVADFANVVPFVGGLVAFVWKAVLLILGLASIHRTTQGRAAAAVLVPILVCCVCVALAMVAGVFAVGSFLSHH